MDLMRFRGWFHNYNQILIAFLNSHILVLCVSKHNILFYCFYYFLMYWNINMIAFNPSVLSGPIRLINTWVCSAGIKIVPLIGLFRSQSGAIFITIGAAVRTQTTPLTSAHSLGKSSKV